MSPQVVLLRCEFERCYATRRLPQSLTIPTEAPSRILIVGNAGSGKSFLARQGHQRLFDGFTGRRLRFENREQVNAFIAGLV